MGDFCWIILVLILLFSLVVGFCCYWRSNFVSYAKIMAYDYPAIVAPNTLSVNLTAKLKKVHADILEICVDYFSQICEVESHVGKLFWDQFNNNNWRNTRENSNNS
jgi:hypothetical protein